MKNKYLKLVLCGFMIFSVNVLKSQDPQFSQFYNSSIYYNPATAGLNRDLRFSSTYRDLWSRIPGDLSTYFISADYQWSRKNIGVGFLMLSDNEGLNRIRTKRMELVYSYRVLQDQDRMLQLGMSVFSINMRDFRNSDFIFTDQLDPVLGVVRQSSFLNDEVEPVVYPDWNAGMVYRQNLLNNITPTIGISVSHILRPNISFVNNVFRLPVKYVVNGNLLTRVVFNKGKVGRIRGALMNPGFVYEYQKPFQTFTFGSGFDVEPLRFGMWFRNRSLFADDVYKINSIIMHAGIVMSSGSNHDLIIDYTYDSTISKLEFASGGAHEITIIYNISLPERKGAVECYKEWWRELRGRAIPLKRK